MTAASTESPPFGWSPTFRGRPVPTDRALIMAIVNRTPDSFFDRGATFAEADALAAVDAAVAEGADFIDIGGVKAGPGAEVDEAAELARVIPFIEAVRARYPDVLLSVDTWRSGVAREAAAAGVDLINDTWQGADPELIDVAGAAGVGLVCSHTGGARVRTRPFRVRYADVVADVVEQTTATAARALAAGVPKDAVLIDPTHDFGKNTYHGLALLRHVDELVKTGFPVLMALSNKDFVGETLGVPLDDRLEGTLAATAVAAASGARVFRVHQVRQTMQVLEMVAAIGGYRAPAAAVRGLA